MQEVKVDRTNYCGQVGLKKIWYVIQFTFLNMAGTDSEQKCNHTVAKASHSNLVSRTPDLSYLLVSSRLISSSFPIEVILVPNSTILTENKVK
jgi:hypothetical protein